MFAKQILILLAGIIWFIAFNQATGADISVFPPNPTSEDNVQITVTGTLGWVDKNCGDFIKAHSHSIEGENITIHLIASTQPGAICIQVFGVPHTFSITEEIGKLPKGEYSVRAEITNDVLPPISSPDIPNNSLIFSVDSATNGRKLIIPELTAKSGDTITVPINVTDATGVAGADIMVAYDKNVLTIKEGKTTTLSSGMNLIVNTETAGKITLAMAGTKGITEGSGAIVEIVFEVSTVAKGGSKIPLTFIDALLYDELGNHIPVQAEDGILMIEEEFPPWDVNCDGIVDISDLVLVGIHFGEDYRQGAPVSPLVGKMRSRNAEGDLWIEAKVQMDSGKYLHVQLKISPITDLYGYQFDLGYDPTTLELLTVTASSLLKQNGTQTYWTVSERGALINAMHVRQATKQGINANGTLATIVFRVKDIKNSKNSPVYLANIKLADSKARLIPLNIRAINLSLRQLFIPTKSLLAQNYPNPFNPETWIPYQLAKDATVTIRIYNAKGQLIRILPLGDQQAGIYVTKGKAAYWNGKDVTGQAVGSGVYFIFKPATFLLCARWLS